LGAEPELDVIIRLPRAGSCDKITTEREKRLQGGDRIAQVGPGESILGPTPPLLVCGLDGVLVSLTRDRTP